MPDERSAHPRPLYSVRPDDGAVSLAPAARWRTGRAAQALALPLSFASRVRALLSTRPLGYAYRALHIKRRAAPLLAMLGPWPIEVYKAARTGAAEEGLGAI
jgi:hypothetical protein